MLRALTVCDADAVASLIRVAFAAQSVVTDPLPSALRVTAADVTAHLQRGGGGAVAELDGALAGSALWEEKDGGLYVSRVAVAAGWRRRGIARALMAAAEAAASGMHLPRVHLSTRLVLADNRRLFAGCGFVETERTAHPGYAEPTSVGMEKLLTSPAGAGEVETQSVEGEGDRVGTPQLRYGACRGTLTLGAVAPITSPARSAGEVIGLAKNP